MATRFWRTKGEIDMFNILYNDNLSLDDILDMQKKGVSFIRSAHIGNWNKQTIVLGKLNIHILMHEFLKGTAKIYEPAYIKFNGKKIKFLKMLMFYNCMIIHLFTVIVIIFLNHLIFIMIH